MLPANNGGYSGTTTTTTRGATTTSSSYNNTTRNNNSKPNNNKPITITSCRLSSGLGLAAVLAVLLNGFVLYLHATTGTISSSFYSVQPPSSVTTSSDCHCPQPSTTSTAAAKPCPPSTATTPAGAASTKTTKAERSLTSGVSNSTTTSTSSTSSLKPKSILLPPAAEYVRRGDVDLHTIYEFPDKSKNKWCSCLNPIVNTTKCCQRLFRRVHKMGYILSLDMFVDFPQIKLYGIEPKANDYMKRKPQGDFRDVLMWRDIYNSIVSGYLYHKDGRECYKDPWGNPSDKHHFHLVRSWRKHLSYEIPEKQRKMMFCNYLLREKEEKGLKAYIEWVFHAHYNVTLSAWALSKGLPYVGERTLNICYEDLASKDVNRSMATMNSVLDFFFNGTKHKPWRGFEPTTNEAGGHATSKDPDMRKRLIKTIKQLDHKYYNGDIAWLDSMLPC